MAVLCILAVDKRHPTDALLDARQPKAGHVIDILPDGQSPGTAIENNPKWKIVHLPGVPVSEVGFLLMRGKTDPQARRELQFDVKKLKAEMALDDLASAVNMIGGEAKNAADYLNWKAKWQK